MTRAADRLAELMDDPNSSVALGACTSVLALGLLYAWRKRALTWQ